MTTTTPVMVRTSERTLFTRCRQAWWWSYVEQRKPIEYWNRHLVFGDMIHRALAGYYIPETRKDRKRGPHPAGLFQKIYDHIDQNGKKFEMKVDEEFWIDARDLGTAMLEGYVDRWKEDDKDILVLYPEMPFQFEIRDPKTGKQICVYVGTSDALIMRISTKQVGLFEHKTAGAIDTGHLFMDEQANTYWTLIPEWLRLEEVFSKNLDFGFMLYNYLRKTEEDDRPQNADGHYLNMPTVKALKDWLDGHEIEYEKGAKKEELEELISFEGFDPAMLGEVSKTQPPPRYHREIITRGDPERVNAFQRIVEQTAEMNLVRAGKMPHYKSPSKECKWCEWKDLCELHEGGADWKELRRATRKWDPYTDHVWALELP